VWGLLTAAGAVVYAATLLSFLGRFSWILDLFFHFRVQYLCCLVLIGVIVAIGRRRRAAVVLLAFACVNLALVLPLHFGKQSQSVDASPAFRAMFLNVNTRLGDADRVKEVVTEDAPDILVLEEISSGWVAALSWLTNSYPHSCAEPREDNFGIGIFSKVPIVESEVAYIGDAGVPSIRAALDTGHSDLHVLATHPLPPGSRGYARLRDVQLGSLPDYVRSGYAVLLLGDLNTTPWNYQFRRLLARTGSATEPRATACSQPGRATTLFSGYRSTTASTQTEL